MNTFNTPSGLAAFDTKCLPTLNCKVTAREYIVRLDASRFSPYITGNQGWFTLATTEACRLGMKFVAHNNTPIHRVSWFLDTEDHCLRRNGLSLNVIEGGSQDKRVQIRLSKTSCDRHLAAMVNIRGRGNAVNEFIEEIGAVQSLYVNSSTVFRHKLPPIYTVEDIVKLFPTTALYLEPRTGDAVTFVGGMIASELAHTVGTGTIDRCPPVLFRMTAMFDYYRRKCDYIADALLKRTPRAVEFSFSYDSLDDKSDMERFPYENVMICQHLLRSLLSQRGWIHPSPKRRMDDYYEGGATLEEINTALWDSSGRLKSHTRARGPRGADRKQHPAG